MALGRRKNSVERRESVDSLQNEGRVASYVFIILASVLLISVIGCIISETDDADADNITLPIEVSGGKGSIKDSSGNVVEGYDIGQYDYNIGAIVASEKKIVIQGSLRTNSITLYAHPSDGYDFYQWQIYEPTLKIWFDATKVIEIGAKSLTLDKYAKVGACFTPHTYKATFVGNYVGSSYSVELDAKFDSKYSVPTTNPERTGYTFAGWNTESDGSGKVITNNVDVATASNHSIYAQWTPKTYSVTLDKNGGATAGSTKATFDSKILTDTTDATPQPGYTLSGYYTEATGDTMVITSGGELVANVEGFTNDKGEWTRDTTDTTILYAHWTPIIYTVEINKGITVVGGTDITDTSFKMTVESDVTITLKDVGYKGFKDIVGVSRDSTTGKLTVDTNASNHSIKGDPITYTITVNGNGITISGTTVSSGTFTMTVEDTITATLKDGYKDLVGTGVSIDANGKISITNFDSAGVHSMTSTAITYTITIGDGAIVTKGGVVVTTETFEMTVENTDVIATAKTGYKNPITGSGITVDPSTGKVTITGEFSVLGKTIAATPITYQIVFNAGDGGQGQMDPMGCTYNVTYTLPQVAYTKVGYVFVCWKDNNGNEYANLQDVKNLVTTDGGSITLTAQWELKDITIVITVNDSQFGSVDRQSVYLHYSATIVVDGNKLIITDSKAGTIVITATPSPDTHQYRYSFATWGDPTSPVTEDMTITATFSRETKSYIVFFESDGTVVDQQSVLYGNTVNRYDVEKSGYIFLGWYDGESLWNFDTPIVDETHLVAKWEKIESVIVVIETDDDGNAEVQVPTDGTVEDIVIINEKDSIALTIPAESVPKTEERKIVTQLICLGEDDYEVVVEYEDKESFHGNMIVTLPFDLKKGSPIVYWVVDGTYVQMMTTVDFENGLISFETDHNSEYIVSYVGVPAGEIDNNVLYAAIGIVVALIAILGIGMYAYRH